MVGTRKRKLPLKEEPDLQQNIKKKRTIKATTEKNSTHQETESSNEVTSTINTTETEQSLSGLIHEPSWAINLRDLFNDSNFQNIEKFLNNQWSSGKVTFPPKNLIFEAFNKTPFNQVKVVLLGQDPYHDDGQVRSNCFFY